MRYGRCRIVCFTLHGDRNVDSRSRSEALRWNVGDGELQLLCPRQFPAINGD
tara:strand:- start:656 stop:811 length:156 start_codon:yes stop_codon:yes gene_type:complete